MGRSLTILALGALALTAGCRVSRPDLQAGAGARDAGLAQGSEAGAVPPRSYVCRRASEPPALEGSFEDGPWQQAPWTEDFVVVRRREPGGSVRTRAKMLWDDAYLYCVVELLEPQQADAASRPPRHDVDILVADDAARPSYEIEVVGMGTIKDARFDGPEGARTSDLKWDAKGLKTSVQKSSDGATLRWTAGFALPWSTLVRQDAPQATPPSAPKPGAIWRVDMGRSTWRPVATEEEGLPQAAGYERAAWQPPADPAEPGGWGAVEFAP